MTITLSASILGIFQHHIGYVLLMLLGGVVHLFGTLMEKSVTQGKRMTIAQFRKAHPYQLIYGFFAAVACYVIVFKMGELNAVSAIACGYMGDSLIKKKMAMSK